MSKMPALIRAKLPPGWLQAGLLIGAVTLAYGLDYLFNLTAGRLLPPSEFSILVAVAGVGQVLVVASRIIQTVVTRYIARFQVAENSGQKTAAFFQAMFRASWVWGTVAMLVLAVLSIPLAQFLHIADIKPVLVLAVAALLMVVRPVVGGALQGGQQFGIMGGVQMVQAMLRLLLGVLFIWLGWEAFGAMLSLPVASLAALFFGYFLLMPIFKQKSAIAHGVELPEMFRYTSFTAVGFVGYAILLNMDAILVRRFFSVADAGNYSAAITLGKVIQFFPVAVIMLLFPKAAQRQAARQDASRILMPAMGIVILVCGGIALLYALFPQFIIDLTLGSRYQVDGLVLGLVGMAMLFLSLANVWLNYFLSTEWPHFVYLVVAAIVLQAGLMALFHDKVWQMPAIMAANGLWLTIAGMIIFMRQKRRRVAS